MIYGQDEAIAFPVADLYDSGVMQMYINAVRDQYQQGLKDYENFMSKYGDFTSPFRKDVDMWNREVMGPTTDLINKMYAAGIDPTRNPEARAMIQQSMRTVPYDKVAKARQNAKAGEEYIKNRGILAAKGLYDKDYTDFWLNEQGYKPFEEWSAEDGLWNISSPIEYKDLFTATDPWFKNMKPHDMTAEQVRRAGYTYNPKYKYSGIPVEDLEQITGDKIPGFMNSIEGRYYRNKVEKELAAAGIEPTKEAVDAELAKRIVTANHAKVVDPTSDADEYAKMDYAQRIDNEKAARDHKYDIAKMKFSYENDPSKLRYFDYDENGNLIVSKSPGSRSSSGGGGTSKESFSDAEYQLMRGTTNILGKTGYGQGLGIATYDQFDPDRMNYLLAPAQSDIASKFYTGDILNNNTVTQIGSSSKNGRVNIGFNPDAFLSTRTQSSQFGTKQYNNALQTANKNFLNEIALDYSPAKFAKWTNRSTLSGDDTMILIKNDDDALNRIYSVDEVALNTAGVDRPEDLPYAQQRTNSIRSIIGKKGHYAKSTGKYISKLENDGSVHTYQFVKIYSSAASGKGTSAPAVKNTGELKDVGIVLWDMGITTYDNPNFGINGNTSTNLYFDDAKDADTRWSGDMNVLHWEHIGAPQIESTIAYPQLP